MKSLFFVFFFFPFFSWGNCTLNVPIVGTIGPATLDFFERGVQLAKAKDCQSILLSVNTPGGNLQSTRLIVEKILNSEIPILCLVTPAGGHAGSAGAIILQACHISGALKATNIGAATPILGAGGETPEDLRKKMINDTVSWLESLTELRSRNKDFGREIITEAKAVSAEEALKLGAIEAVVKDSQEFLDFCLGRTVLLGPDKEIKVQVGELVQQPVDIRFQVLQLMSDPQLSYLMFMGSLGLLYFEVTHPGSLIPGVLGSIGLVVSLISFHKMNVYWGGVALIFLGLLLFGLELFLPSFGVLGLGGSVAFVLGSILLFDPSTGYHLPIMTIVSTALVLIAMLSGLVWLAISSRNLKRQSGYDGLPGAEGVVLSVAVGGRSGQARVLGEIWKFESETPLLKGDELTVVGHQGLTIEVKKKGD